jgi:hypothetical protein
MNPKHIAIGIQNTFRKITKNKIGIKQQWKKLVKNAFLSYICES